jgi:hypothetical protein
MSSAAVLTRPPTEQVETGWIELDEFDVSAGFVNLSADSDAAFIELEPATTAYETQEQMRFGPRSYTREQTNVIELAVRQRKPLQASPLPLDE